MSAEREVSRDLTTLVAYIAKATDDYAFGEDVTIDRSSYNSWVTQLMAIAADVAELEDLLFLVRDRREQRLESMERDGGRPTKEVA